MRQPSLAGRRVGCRRGSRCGNRPAGGTRQRPRRGRRRTARPAGVTSGRHRTHRTRAASFRTASACNRRSWRAARRCRRCRRSQTHRTRPRGARAQDLTHLPIDDSEPRLPGRLGDRPEMPALERCHDEKTMGEQRLRLIGDKHGRDRRVDAVLPQDVEDEGFLLHLPAPFVGIDLHDDGAAVACPHAKDRVHSTGQPRDRLSAEIVTGGPHDAIGAREIELDFFRAH
jgi:hypothetical protein